MTLFEVLQQPNFEIDYADIGVTIPKSDCVEQRCYTAESIPELKFIVETLFKSIDDVLIVIHGKLDGEYKCYACFTDKEQVLSNEEWKQILPFKKNETNILKRFCNWLRGKANGT